MKVIDMKVAPTLNLLFAMSFCELRMSIKFDISYRHGGLVVYKEVITDVYKEVITDVRENLKIMQWFRIFAMLCHQSIVFHVIAYYPNSKINHIGRMRKFKIWLLDTISGQFCCPFINLSSF